MTILDTPLPLPRGKALPNRIMKSAMSEVLGSPTHAPTEALARLYRAWAHGGLGLAITGNVMIDPRAIGEPANVVVEDERDLDALRAWASAGAEAAGQIWMQINHPGKQSPRFLTPEPVAPSAIPLGNGLERAFASPRALTSEEIDEIIERFGNTARIAKKAGFGGVQIHGAHGYLVSQFLSPHHNRRDDAWGGTPEKRAAFALAVYRSIRREVGDDFPVSIKINSADFQKGGMTEDASIDVIAGLVDEGIDFVEISGGNYESPAMTGQGARESTIRREAYFLSFAEKLRTRVEVALAVTGGFRTAEGMTAAVESGAVDVVGLARALALEPDLPKRVLAGEPFVSKVRSLSTGSKLIDRFSMLDVTFYENQLARIADGRGPDPEMHPLRSVLTTIASQGAQAFKQRRAR